MDRRLRLEPDFRAVILVVVLQLIVSYVIEMPVAYVCLLNWPSAPNHRRLKVAKIEI